MAEVDPLILELRANHHAYIEGLTQAQRVSETRLTAIEKAGDRMGTRLKGGFDLAKSAAAGFIASLSVDAVLRAVNSGLQYAASLQEVAQQLGVTTDALQEYRYAGSQAGLATEETDMALSQLTRRIGEAANGTKEQAQAFEKLGVSVKGANGEILNAGDAIPQIADALQRIESPAERAAILMDLFGRSGQKLEPLLSGGSKAVNQLRDAAHKLGIVLSQRQIARADETADKLDALKQVLSAKIAGTVSDNAGSILQLANSLESLASRALSAGKSYTDFANKIEKGMATIQRGGGILQRNYGFATGNQGFISNGMNVIRQGENRLAPFNSKKRGGYRAGVSNFTAQSNPFESFQSALAPPEAAAIALGPTPQQASLINKKLNDTQRELLPIFVDLNTVVADLVDTVEARVAAEKVQIEADKIAAIDRVNANKDLSDADKALAIQGYQALAEGKIELASRKLEADARERGAQAASDAAELAEIESRNAIAALEYQYDLATSQAERARIAQQIVDTETQAALDALDAQLLAEEITDAKRDQLEAIRRGIVADGARARDNAAQDNMGAIGQELARLNRMNFGDQAEGYGVEALNDLNRGLADAIVNGGDLGDVLEDTGKRFIAQLLEMAMQLLIIKPLLEGLGNIGTPTGGGGFFSNVIGSIGSIFGRASGGRVDAGTMYRVNEANQEFFRPDVAGQVIPLSKMRAQSGGAAVSQPAVIKIYADEGAAFVPRVEAISGQVAVETVRIAAPTIRDSAVQETFRRGSRPGFR